MLLAACVVVLTAHSLPARAGGTGGTGGTGGAAPSVTTTTIATTTTGVTTGGVCDSGLTVGDESTDGCLTDMCCASFDACAVDANCRACLLGEGIACDANGSYQTWLACSEENCTADVCGTGFGFTTNGVVDYPCNGCVTQCCTCIEGCIAGGTEPEVENCLDCLVDPDACTDPGIAAWARSFHACTDESCSNECGTSDVPGGDAAVCLAPSAGGDDSMANGSGGGGGALNTAPQPENCSCAAPGQNGNATWGWLMVAGCVAAWRRRPRHQAAGS